MLCEFTNLVLHRGALYYVHDCNSEDECARVQQALPALRPMPEGFGPVWTGAGAGVYKPIKVVSKRQAARNAPWRHARRTEVRAC